MYCVNWNQGKGSIILEVTFLDKFYNLPLMKNFDYRLLRNYESCKVETWYIHGKMTNFRLSFLKNCKGTTLKPGTHMNSGLMHCVYHNQGQGLITFGVKSCDRFYNLP